MSYDPAYAQRFSFSTPITVGMATTTLVADPGAGRQLRVQALTICVTTTAAVTFDIEDSTGTVELFKAPSSLAVGTYAVDAGSLGVGLTTHTALQYTGSAGAGVTVSGFGYIQENA